MRQSDDNALRGPSETGFAPGEAENLLGDFSALLQTIGVGGVLPVCESPSLPATRSVANFAALRAILENYFTQILLPVELPAISEACGRARRGQWRELIDLDQQLAGDTRVTPFASASRRIGEMHLRRMQPLRDERTVQRYLRAVESGEACGWHSLVYGLTLAVYSFPLRQGLNHYGRQTLTAFARAAAGVELFCAPECQEILESVLARLPEAVERTIESDAAVN